MTEAARRVAIQVAGVALAVATAWWLGPTAGSIPAVLAVVLATRGRRAFDDQLQVASTTLITLTAAAAMPVRDLALLALATLTGAVVGTAAHALILPPVHAADSRTAVRRPARVTSLLLRDMGRGLCQHRRTSHVRVWLSRARQLEEEIAEAQDQVRLAEDSLRWNLRCSVHGSRRPCAPRPAWDITEWCRRVMAVAVGSAPGLMDEAGCVPGADGGACGAVSFRCGSRRTTKVRPSVSWRTALDQPACSWAISSSSSAMPRRSAGVSTASGVMTTRAPPGRRRRPSARRVLSRVVGDGYTNRRVIRS